MVNRSWLYVPGDARDMLDGALARGADAVIVDLEDSIAPAAKDAARAMVVEWVSSLAGDPRTRAEVWVRINATPQWRAKDLRALVGLDLDGVIVPKASAELVIEVNRALGGDNAPRVAALVEDAQALVTLATLAATPGLSHLGMGEADLRAQLHLDPGQHEAELRPLRLAVMVASAAAGIQPPVGATSTDFRDLDTLRASTTRLRRLGFAGRTAIHPRQVAVINEVFTPSENEIADARNLVDRLDTATRDGMGVVTDADGRMVDEAVARQARHTLGLAAAAQRHDDRG